jgi:hypothetical protein
MRKPLRHAAPPRQRGRVTRAQIMAWLDERLAEDPDLLRRVKHVLAALRKEQATRGRKQRRAG